MLAVEMESVEDKSSARYKKLAKQKRSQEDRLRNKNKFKTDEKKIEMMGEVIQMLMKEARASLTEKKARSFELAIKKLNRKAN